MKKVDTQRSPDFRIYDLLPVLDDLVWKYRKSLLVVVVDVWMETFELGVGILPYLLQPPDQSMCTFITVPWKLLRPSSYNSSWLLSCRNNASVYAAAAKSLQLCSTVRPHRLQPTRLSHPWDSPGKNTGVSCMKGKSESDVAQSCWTLSDPMDCSPPGSSVPWIFQARVLEWVAIAFSAVYARIA